MTDFNKLYISLRSLAVFRALLNDPVVSALCDYLIARGTGNEAECINRYCEMTARLYANSTDDFSEYLAQIVYNDENAFIKAAGGGGECPSEISAAAAAELEILQRIASLSSGELLENLNLSIKLPGFRSKSIRLVENYFNRVKNIWKYGFGIYSRYYMFYLDSDYHIVPVYNPDKIRLSELADYKREQRLIIDNTRALLAGKPAANTLLTGDAGTGKSSTVKAVVNELHNEGLRIIEVRRDQLHRLPALLDELASNPLKFIIFIDDLSFAGNDGNFSALKAVLEGSVSAKSKNVVIYATSNRRHLIKESFSERDGDDVHRNDTMQELVSLSERFGLQITFQRPDKQTYLDIVRKLAEENNINMQRSELEESAERFVLNRGSRSARAARQFIDSLLSSEQN